MTDRELIMNAGIQKKSFELFYNGGSIWCEHLDAMGCCADEVKDKFLNDYKTFSKPSMTSFMIINLDNTELFDDVISCITDTIIHSAKRYVKIAFVGIKKSKRSAFRTIQRLKGCAVNFFDDYEKAKQWILP
ncbi:MAG: hypothetical protein ACI4KA_00380 [Oscillospiraceae bacterium]